MFEQINDPIEVKVLFRQGKTLPFRFMWKNQEIGIKKVNLVWSSFEGKIKVYYFAVSDEVNYYKLSFNTDSLNWMLMESYTD
jgi:hypothetical protein